MATRQSRSVEISVPLAGSLGWANVPQLASAAEATKRDVEVTDLRRGSPSGWRRIRINSNGLGYWRPRLGIEPRLPRFAVSSVAAPPRGHITVVMGRSLQTLDALRKNLRDRQQNSIRPHSWCRWQELHQASGKSSQLHIRNAHTESSPWYCRPSWRWRRAFAFRGNLSPPRSRADRPRSRPASPRSPPCRRHDRQRPRR